MKQRIWIAVFFVVGYLVMRLLVTHQRHAEEQAQEAILREPIVLTEAGFIVNDKEIRFGMSKAEVFALLGEPTFIPTDKAEDSWLMGYSYRKRFLLLFRNEYFAPQEAFYLERVLFTFDTKAPIKLGDTTFYPSEKYLQAVARLDTMAIAGATIEQTEEATTWRRGEAILTLSALSASERGSMLWISYENEKLPRFPPMQLELLSDGFSLDGSLLAFGMSRGEVEAILGAPQSLNDRGNATYFHTVGLRFREEQNRLALDALDLFLPTHRGEVIHLLGEEFSLKDDWLAIQARLQAIDDPAFYLDVAETDSLTVRWHNTLLTLRNHQHFVSMNYRWQE